MEPTGPDGSTQPDDPGRWRVSDQERHEVAEVLRLAAGEGRIDLEELDQRLEAAYAARTYAELVPLTADLPAVRRPGVVSPFRAAGTSVHLPAYPTSVAVMAETRRGGLWQVGQHLSAFALMGSVVLDLRQAQFTSRDMTITANALMGGVEIVVDPAVVVVVDGVGIMGEFAERRTRKVRPQVVAGAPVVRVKGVAVMGSVTVRRGTLDAPR
jgi:hypothetical protein